MNLRLISTLVAVGAFVAPSLVPAKAAAQDFTRFRGGVGLETGAIVVTAGADGAVAIGTGGIQGQLGVQINNNWAVYAQPNIDFLFAAGGTFGLNVGGAVLGEYTFSGAPISIGAGPSTGALIAIGDGQAFATAPFYGAKVHFAVYPLMNRDDGGRRKALYLALDLNAQAFPQAGPSVLLFSPLASIGYQAF
jgi:hypothetical protein